MVDPFPLGGGGEGVGDGLLRESREIEDAGIVEDDDEEVCYDSRGIV